MDRLAKEALRESLDESKSKPMSISNEIILKSHEVCKEVWNSDIEEKVLLLSKTIVDKTPQEGWSYILEMCIWELVDIITPVESAGILSSMIYGKFKESERPTTLPILVMGGDIKSAIFGNTLKDKDETGMVA